MIPRYYHTPPPPASTRVRCPICREPVYSRAGVHPQCAMRQDEPPRSKAKAPRSLGTPNGPAKAIEQAGVRDMAIPPEPAVG